MAKKFQAKTTSIGDYYHNLKKISEGNLAPINVVAGGQDYFRRTALKLLEKNAIKKNPELALISFQGPASANETNLKPSAILEELSSYGLFASQKMVVVKRAQRFLFPSRNTSSDESEESTSNLDELINYISNPTEGMFLVLELESIDKRKKIGKELVKHANVIECPTLKWESEVISWIKQDMQERGHSISSGAANMLYTLYGTDPGVISGEIDKLCIFAGKIPQITEDDVKAFMGDSIALTGFELVNSIEERNTAKALSFARQYIEQGFSSQGKSAGIIGSVHMALGSIRACILRIWQAHDIVAAGGGMSEIESTFRARGRRAEVIFSAAQKYNLFDIKNAFNALSESLARLHDTGSDPALELEMAVLAICGKHKGIAVKS